MERYHSLRFLALLISFFLSGFGLTILGRTKHFCLIQLSIWLSFFILCATRQVFDPQILSYYLFTLLTVHVLLLIFSFKLILNKDIRYTLKSAVNSSFIAISLLVLFVLVFLNKNWLLGLDLYFIPSNSMERTLSPGDFILVDTKLYNNSLPQIDHIVVFKHPTKNLTLVKRVSYWPHKNKVVVGNELFLTGDNPQHSVDSRTFGGVPSTNLKGKAELIIYSLARNRKKLKSNIFPLFEEIH